MSGLFHDWGDFRDVHARPQSRYTWVIRDADGERFRLTYADETRTGDPIEIESAEEAKLADRRALFAAPLQDT